MYLNDRVRVNDEFGWGAFSCFEMGLDALRQDVVPLGLACSREVGVFKGSLGYNANRAASDGRKGLFRSTREEPYEPSSKLCNVPYLAGWPLTDNSVGGARNYGRSHI